MYAVAILGDIASLVPVVNIFSGAITAIALAIIGSETGVSLYSGKRIGATFATLIAEVMPGLSALPLWTIRVYFAKQSAKKEKEEA